MMRFILPSVLFLEAHALGCREKLGNFDVSFPEWQAVLADPNATVDTWDNGTFTNTTQFTSADVPGVLGLIYGFWGGMFSAAGFNASTFTQITEAEKLTQSYVTFFPNQGCNATNCHDVAQAAAANNVTVMPLAGQSYALGECTKFVFGGPLAIVVSMDPTNGNCQLGVYTGHSCDPTGTPAETPKNQPSGTCDDFPLNQGFKMKVHCVQDDGSTAATFKTPQTSFLQNLMYMGTCVPEGYTEFPCTMPANDTNPSNDTDSDNATSGSLAVVGASSVLALLALF